ncbi:MAG: ethylbenzene dehydrogenase-related protein [Planctomycetota bacterium]|jgi:hypothetical protein
MRKLLAGLVLLAACSEAPGPGEPVAQPATPPLRLVAHRVPEGARVLLDGRDAEQVWRKGGALKVPLAGEGVAEVSLRAAYDDDRVYLLATWADETLSMNRYWQYEALQKWSRHTGEDAFSVLWSSGAAFREQGCALYCHGDGERHAYEAGRAGGRADVWYWGAQTTGWKHVLRDMWIPFGAGQRLRGDSQPAGSDNLPNLSEEPGYAGPWGSPARVGKRRNPMILQASNVQQLKKERLEKLNTKENIGWKVALDIQRPILGSRADVRARAQHLGKVWILELSRKRTTGHDDDLAMVDPLVPPLFAVAVHDGSEKDAHTVSGLIELKFDVAR